MSKDKREFDFSADDFNQVVKLVSAKTGIVLGEHKEPMIYSRLARRLRALKFKKFKEYLVYLEGENGDAEVVDFVNAVTTNLTHFFREIHHFEHLEKEVLAPLAKSPPPGKRVRIWSAGCSSGMEPHTIAMCLHESIMALASWDAKILATDIDTNMLDTGRAGKYSREATDKIPKKYRKYLVGDNNKNTNEPVEMADKLKKLIAFKQLNLLDEFPIKGQFDAIFCRNVVIYFDKDTQKILFDKIANVLKPGGWLYIGHSENLFNVSDRFDSLGQTIYRKIK